MRLCFISAFPPEKGNLAEYGYYLVNEFAKHKSIDEIVVLANTNESRKVEKSKVKIIRCWKNNNPFIPLRIIKNLKKENPDLVYFNLHMMSWGKSRVINFLGALTPYLVRKFLRKKVIITLHNIVEAVELEELGIKRSKINLFGAYLATNFLLNVDKVVVTLRKFVSLLNEKYKKDNIIHIPHGTLGKRVESIPNGKTILSFGFWRENKNLPLLIEVFKELSEKDKGLKLVIAGSSHPNFPSYLSKVKQKFKNLENISFTGYVPVDQTDKIFTSSTIVVLPYTAATGTSGVVHLAISYGLPVIISDLPEIRETVEEENLSLILIPKNDKKALKHAIQKLLNDKKLRQEIGNRNLKAAEKLSFFNISKQYVKLFEELVE